MFRSTSTVNHFKRLLRQYSGAALLCVSASAIAASPSVPSDLNGNVEDGQVTIEWSASTDDNSVAGYNVYLNNRYVSTVFDTRYSAPIDTSRQNTYYVTAFDEPLAGDARAYSGRSLEIIFGRGDSSNPIIPVDLPDSEAPSIPAGLVLRSANSTSVIFRWAAAKDNIRVIGYNIYRQGQYYDTVFETRYVDREPLDEAKVGYTVVAFDAALNFTAQSEPLVVMAGDEEVIPEIPEIPEVPETPEIPEIPEEPETPEIPENPVEPETPEIPEIPEESETPEIPEIPEEPETPEVPVEPETPETPETPEETVTPFHPEFPGAPLVPVNPRDPVDDSGEMVPVLDPSNRFPSPNPDDPFGAELEIDDEEALPGGPPTTPKNLRFDLVSNNWAEINWAPANDDTAVVAYNIYRSDGVVYVVAPNIVDENPGSQREIDKYWNTTSFIDCNFTRFDQRVHNCRANQPTPGETYSYRVSAVDTEGNESPLSRALSITYHLPENAPVPIFEDFYKGVDDRFAQNNDLSETRFFLDEFDLIFRDEFDGSSLDESKWQTQLTWGDEVIINGEQQYFVPIQENPEFGYDPFSFDGEQMTISAIPTPENLRDSLPEVCEADDAFDNERCLFLSGALSSHDRFGFLYGYVEGRMKVGGTSGMLSSFYLYHRFPGTGLSLNAPEIDIIEYLGENPFGAEDAFQTYHFGDVTTGQTRSSPTMSFKNPDGELYSDDYHTFGVLWEPQLVIWYIDGHEVKRLTGPMVSRQPMNIVNYLVAGSGWAPTPDLSDPDIFPLNLDVDYIRVYQREAYQGTATFGP